MTESDSAYVSVTISIPASLRGRIDTAAWKGRMNRSKFMLKAMEEYLGRQATGDAGTDESEPSTDG